MCIVDTKIYLKKVKQRKISIKGDKGRILTFGESSMLSIQEEKYLWFLS